MHPKAPPYKIPLLSPLSHSHKDDETKTSYQFSQLAKSESTKLQPPLHQRRPVSLSFNLGKIMPKTISHDRQTLYEENLKLKDKLKQVNQEVARLRTRVCASENQVEKVIQATYTDITKSNTNMGVGKADRVEGSQTGVSKISWMCFQSQNLLKKELMKSREQNLRLKQTNQKLRKSLKYTQIQQLSIQNSHLSEQCTRLSKLLETTTTTNFKQSYLNEVDLKNLREQLVRVKEQNVFITQQLRIKVQEIGVMREEIGRVRDRERKLEEEKKRGESRRSPALASKLEKQEIKRQKTISNHITLTQPQQPQKQPQQIQQQNTIIHHHKNRTPQPHQQTHRQSPTLQKPQPQLTTNSKSKTSLPICPPPPLPPPQPIPTILSQLKQLLTYRFKSQRYTFLDMRDDLLGTNLEFLSVQQVEGLLMNQPFFLKGDELGFVMGKVLGVDRWEGTRIGVGEFLGKLRVLVDDFDLMEEEKQQTYLLKWKKILKQCQPALTQKTKPNPIVTKHQFTQLLTQTQICPQQIEILLAEASMVSTSTNSLNFPAFIAKIMHY